MKLNWRVLRLVLGLAIGIGYIYNIAVGGVPDAAEGTLVKFGFYSGTAIGLLAATLLVVSGLRKKGS